MRSGPCSPWSGGSDVERLPWVKEAVERLTARGHIEPGDVSDLCAEAALAASEILYELSGRIFSGECGPVTVRPVSRPTDIDTRSWGARLSPLGWFSSWGLSASYGAAMPGVVAHYGSVNPPEVELGAFPVTEIVQVKIDGVVIPAAEYELKDGRKLLRVRPAEGNPTERFGWPTSQILDRPDTEPGTFSVTYKYGQPPPNSGKLAARKLAEYLVLPQLGDATKYPQRVTSVQRQGVSAMVVDVMDIVKTGKTGIYEVDLFLRSVNPTQNRRQARVFSPDTGRPRRQARVSTGGP